MSKGKAGFDSSKYVKKGLTADTVGKLKEVFEVFDYDGSGQISIEELVNTIFDGFFMSMVKGDRIEIRGFGSWFVKSYKSYVGRNPKTGADVFVPEKKLPFFKVGKELKKRIDS